MDEEANIATAVPPAHYAEPEPEPDPSGYNAHSIKVLKDEEILQFEWAMVGHLANQYGKDEGWIRRGIQACQHVGVNESYFIDRYVREDKSVPFRVDVQEAFRELHLWVAKP